MSNIKLTEKQKLEIQNLWFVENKSSKEIAELYPVNFNHIQRICKSKTPKGMNVRSFRNPHRKLNDFKAIRIIIEVLKNGTSKKELALRYNVSQTAIYMVCTGKNFPHIFQGYQKKYNKEVLALAKK